MSYKQTFHSIFELLTRRFIINCEHIMYSRSPWSTLTIENYAEPIFTPLLIKCVTPEITTLLRNALYFCTNLLNVFVCQDSKHLYLTNYRNI